MNAHKGSSLRVSVWQPSEQHRESPVLGLSIALCVRTRLWLNFFSFAKAFFMGKNKKQERKNHGT